METINFGIIIKIVMAIIVCIGFMYAGYEYGQYRDEYTTSIESRTWDHSQMGYGVREVTRDGFGNIVETNYYIER